MANVTNFAIRACIAGISYLSLMVAARAGGILNDLMVYAPLGLIALVLSDRGRSERVLITGLSRSDASVVRRELLTLVSTTIAVLFGLWWFEAGTAIWVGAAVLSTGLMQGPIDVLLANRLHARRSQRAISAYQLAVNTALLLGFLVASAGHFPAHSLFVCAVFVFTAPALVMLFRLASVASTGQDCGSAPQRWDVVGTLLKLLPPITYALSLGVWRALDAPFDMALRCLFFVYGFFHLSLMSREIAPNLNALFLAVGIALIGTLIAVPVAVLQNAGSSSWAWAQDLTALSLGVLIASTIYAASLKLYGVTLRMREARTYAQNHPAC